MGSGSFPNYKKYYEKNYKYASHPGFDPHYCKYKMLFLTSQYPFFKVDLKVYLS